MSDCKHENRNEYIFVPEGYYVSYCTDCRADFTKDDLDTLERAEKAEALAEEHNARRISTQRECERLRNLTERYRQYVPCGIVKAIEDFVDDSLRSKYGEELDDE